MFDVLLRSVRRSRGAEGPGIVRPGLPGWQWTLLFALVLAGLIWYEARTSALQSAVFTSLASHLTWQVEPGPSGRIVFPAEGPYDVRMGYTRIPAFSRTLERRGFRPLEQARFSPTLEAVARLGITPPYEEPATGGLLVLGAGGDTLYDLAPRRGGFTRYEDVPPLVVSSLLYMENRQLREPPDPRTNPAVDWERLAKATALYAGHRVGLPMRIEGGSTLAIQMEKYRHSAGGRTDSPVEKLRQIVAASLRVYRGGPDTRAARRQIVVDYLNSMPLASAPGYGEVYGLGEGLHAWFGMDPDDVKRALLEPGVTPGKARALKHVLALLYAVRAPSTYLQRDRAALEARVSNYATLLERGGVLEPALARTVRGAPLEFRPGSEVPDAAPLDARKPLYTLRTLLARDLGIATFYDLDRLHLEVESTLHRALQDSTLALFRRLREPDFVASHGLAGEHLFSSGDPAGVVWSLLLYERAPQGNLERVHVDNLAEPFDVNRGMKMELGSTAKLRTLTHYLEIVARLHDELAGLAPGALARRAAGARDPITAWAAATLVAEPDLDLETFLERALDRTYSASPHEVFFTGSGTHVFQNFDPDDDHRVLPVREAVAHSTNLVFIRLMRDLVRWHEARLPYDPDSVLADPQSPVRHRLLAETADQEARVQLFRAWRAQKGLPRAALEARLLGPGGATPRRLASFFYAWHPGASPKALARWLRSHGVVPAPRELERLARVYGKFTLADYAFLLRRHPLELWCAGQLARQPSLSWDRLLARSDHARREASAWLYRTRNRRAQDLRLRIRFEEDAFARMTPYWRRLGFPFQRLVPSYATAIGSSSDRPEALARLMGILVNDGVSRPPLALSRLAFGPETPYYTALAAAPPAGKRVLPVGVARVVRRTLLGVVDHGTAIRLKGAFVTGLGDTIPVGGKTGSGDNRFEVFGRGGRLVASRPVNRTAAFVFYIGDRWYGVITASVEGPRAAAYRFTSSLPLAALRLLAPAFLERVSQAAPQRAAQLASRRDAAVRLALAAQDPGPAASAADAGSPVRREARRDPRLQTADAGRSSTPAEVTPAPPPASREISPARATGPRRATVRRRPGVRPDSTGGRSAPAPQPPAIRGLRT